MIYRTGIDLETVAAIQENVISLNRRGTISIMGLFRSLILTLVAIFCCALVLNAQTTGSISGYVTDPTGAAILQTRITATMVQQNLSRSVESNAEGFYIFNALPPGTYDIATESTGFRRFIRSGVSLTVNQNLRVDVQLQIGAVAEVMEVTGEAPLVDTTSGMMSGLVDDRRVVDIPLNGRNIVSLRRRLGVPAQ